MRGFIFCHGWGFSPLFWNNLKPFFNPSFCWDLGYFGKEEKYYDNNIEWIGIGHSLGSIKLIQSKLPFKKFIFIQGFCNFLGFDEKLHEKQEEILDQMIKNFEKNPISTLRKFHKICGINLPIRNMNSVYLKRDLLELKKCFPLPNKPFLVLGSEDDPIVPQELLKELLNKSLFQRSREILNQNVNLENELTSLKASELENSCSGSKDPRYLKNGLVQGFLKDNFNSFICHKKVRHSLGFSEAKWCSEKIREFCERED